MDIIEAAKHLASARRINVVGVSGSGKSTLARALGEVLNLPYTELDSLFWQPDWTESTDAEFLPKVAAVAEQDQWIIDGNYSRTRDIKWARVQCVIWVDLPKWQTIKRVTARTIGRSWRKQVLWSGNRETFAKGFLSKDSVILWSLTSYARVQAAYGAAMDADKYKHIYFIRLRSQQQIDALTSALAAMNISQHSSAE